MRTEVVEPLSDIALSAGVPSLFVIVGRMNVYFVNFVQKQNLSDYIPFACKNNAMSNFSMNLLKAVFHTSVPHTVDKEF